MLTLANLLVEKQKLEEEIKQLRKEELGKFDGKKLLGFTLGLTKDVKNGVTYWSIRARKRYRGKDLRVYLGNEPEKFEERLRRYILRKKIVD
jgi:hypothetical protein